MPSLRPGLDRRGHLVGLSFPDEIADGDRRDHDLERGDPALPVLGGQEELRTTPWSASASCTRTCCCCAGGNASMMQSIVFGALFVWSAEHEVAGLRGGEGQADGLEVSHLADQDDVGIFAKRRPERRGERLRVGADLRWFTKHPFERWTNSIGSSSVMMCFFCVALTRSIMAASVVNLPEPVGPVTRTRPFSRSASVCMTSGRPSSWNDRICVGMTRKTAPSPFRWLNTFTRNRACSRSRWRSPGRCSSNSRRWSSLRIS
jgi:hypothetical protein